MEAEEINKLIGSMGNVMKMKLSQSKKAEMPYKSESAVGKIHRHVLFHCRIIKVLPIIFSLQPNGLSYLLSV